MKVKKPPFTKSMAKEGFYLSYKILMVVHLLLYYTVAILHDYKGNIVFITKSVMYSHTMLLIF